MLIPGAGGHFSQSPAGLLEVPVWGPGVFLGLCGAVCSLAYAQPTGPACGWTKEEEEGLTRPYRILYYLVKPIRPYWVVLLFLLLLLLRSNLQGYFQSVEGRGNAGSRVWRE